MRNAFMADVRRMLIFVSISWGVLWLIGVFVDNIGEVDVNVKVALISLSGVLLTAVFTHYQTKKREINARFFAEKRAGYDHMLDLIFDLLRAIKRDPKLSEDDRSEKALLFKRALVVWGGSKLITAWNEYEQRGDGDSLKRMEKLLRAIREDLGHHDRTLKPGSLEELFRGPREKNTAPGQN